MKHKALFIILFTAIGLSGHAQQVFKDKSAMTAFAGEVAELFRKNNVPDAFTLMAPYWPVSESEFNDVREKSIEYMNLFHEQLAPASRVVKINEQNVGDFAIRETWCILFQNTAIRLIFTFYKNPEGWILNAFRWNDSFEEEFK